MSTKSRVVPWRCENCNCILAWVCDGEVQALGSDVRFRKDGKAAIICPVCRESNVWHPPPLDIEVSNSL